MERAYNLINEFFEKESNMGAYHSKERLEVFSHTKSILDKKKWIDLPMRYQPYIYSGDVDDLSGGQLHIG